MAMPDEKTVMIYVDGQGKITRTYPSLPDGLGAATAHATVAKLLYNQEVAVQPGADKQASQHTIDQVTHTFTYLDCGRWGGPTNLDANVHREFGIVWGPWAALCQFVPDASCSTNDNYVLDANKARANNKINDVVDALRSANSSVRLVKSLWSTTPPNTPAIQNLDWSAIYVILPDMHLPIRTHQPDTFPNTMPSDFTPEVWDQHASDGAAWGRVEYVPGDDPGRLGKSAYDWFDRYLAGDIFGTEDGPAARDLIQFMKLLSGSSLAGQISFVQLGDFYDLWIGLDCFLDPMDAQVVHIGDRNGIRAGDFIDHWVNETNLIFPDMIRAVNSMPNSRFLWGNHDDYLSPHNPAGLTQRIKEIREKSIYIEHGQRGDKNNRDGSADGTLDGWSVTNHVFFHSSLRSLDPDRRDNYLATSAVAYAVNPDFCVYAMGHTHIPYLTRVKLIIAKDS